MRRLRRYFRRRESRGITPLVFRAHLMLRSGDFEAAAAIFEKLAGDVGPYEADRAADFYIQAGRARIQGGQSEEGLRVIKQGLLLLIHANRAEELRIANQWVISSLARLGFSLQAREIAVWVEENIHQPGFAGNILSEKPPVTHATVNLPLQCPNCGAPIHQKDAVWVDEQTAVCSYCGGLLRGDAQ
jgi:hypothetical protein